MFPELTDAQVQRVAEVIKEFFKRNKEQVSSAERKL
jgi:hypothetical protein